MEAADWFLVGAPWDCSGTGRGEARAPGALRRGGLADLVDVDLGDAATVIESNRRDEPTRVRALPETVAAARALAAALRAGLRAHPDLRPLVVGGDCSLLLGVFAFLRAEVGTVGLWTLDGHPDYLDGPGSETGETADLQLALLTGDGPEALVGLGGSAPMVQARHVALLGHRTADLDSASAAEVARLPADVFTIDAGRRTRPRSARRAPRTPRRVTRPGGGQRRRPARRPRRQRHGGQATRDTARPDTLTTAPASRPTCAHARP